MTKTFALKPGQWMRFGPQIPAGGHIRYDVTSSMPVNTGAAESADAWPSSAACYETQVLNTVKDCIVEPRSKPFIFVADPRTVGDVIAGTILGNNKQEASSYNKVTIVIYHWGCVSNCVVFR